MRIKEIELHDIIHTLPDLKDFNEKEFTDLKYDLYLCALGFEERCITIPEKLALLKNFSVKSSIVFEYSTNKSDNERNLPRLQKSIKKFSGSCSKISCDDDSFANTIRAIFTKITSGNKNISVIFDISVCSSKVILNILTVLFEYQINLKIVYTEAAIYHPTFEEFIADPEKWTTEEGFGLTRGVGQVIPSPEHPGTIRENPNLVIIFPTFKPERTKKILSEIDETLLIYPSDRIIWIVGDPNMDQEKKTQRKEIIKNINNIHSDDYSYEVSTLEYKNTFELLNQIVSKKPNFHINIAILGSKMQSLGIFLFWYIRQDVSLYFTIPEEYNPKQYSEKCKKIWMIDFIHLDEIRHNLNRIGTIEILDNSPPQSS
jgi:hypothetical protein